MKQFGLWNLRSKKGQERFRNTMLTPEEIAVWDLPERPRNLIKLMAVGAKETTKYIRTKIKS